VADLHQIVDLGSLANPGATEAGAVDGGARADFHVVVDLHDASLPHLAMAALVELVAKSIGTNDRTRVQDDTLAQLALGLHGHVRMELAARADDRIAPDKTPRADLGIVADLSPRFNHGVGTDANATRSSVTVGSIAAVSTDARGERRWLEAIGFDDHLKAARRIGHRNGRPLAVGTRGSPRAPALHWPSSWPSAPDSACRGRSSSRPERPL